MPLTFEALKGQRYRWCFGGIQILRMHWRSLLPGPRDQGQPPEHRPALGVPGRRDPVVRRPARPGLLRVPAGRRGQPGHRRRRAVPQAHRFLVADGAGAGGARPGPRGGAAAPGDRRVLAGRDRRVLHLAVHLASWSRGRRCSACSPARRRSCGRRRRASGPSGGRRCGPTGPRSSLAAARPGRHRRRADQVAPSWPGRCWRRCWSSRPWAWPPRRSTAGPRSVRPCPPGLRERRTTEWKRADRRASRRAPPPAAAWSWCRAWSSPPGPAAGAQPPPRAITAPGRRARRSPPRLRRRRRVSAHPPRSRPTLPRPPPSRPRRRTPTPTPSSTPSSTPTTPGLDPAHPRRRRARRIPRRRAHRPHRRETGRPTWADDARPQAGRSHPAPPRPTRATFAK